MAGTSLRNKQYLCNRKGAEKYRGFNVFTGLSKGPHKPKKTNLFFPHFIHFVFSTG